MPHETPIMDDVEDGAEAAAKESSLEEVLAEKAKELSEIKPEMLANNPTLQAEKARLDMEISLLRSFPNNEAYQEFMKKVDQKNEE